MASASRDPDVTAMNPARHRLCVDFAEQNATLLDLAQGFLFIARSDRSDLKIKWKC
jgi:hypothetical protein